MTNGDSVQKRLNKVRPPRVQMTYDVDIGEATENKELPFVLGVVGDFGCNAGGDSDKEHKRLKDRKFVNLDNDNFDEVLKGVEPRATYQVENTLAGDNSTFAVDLKFKLGYDDTLDVVGIHLVAGFIGTLYLGFFAIDTGLFTGGNIEQLVVQVIPAVAIAAYSFVMAFVLGTVIEKTIGFRAKEEDEIAGIDTVLHGEGYAFD